MRHRYGKKGFVLVTSVILLLSISVIVAAFVFLVTTRTRATAYELDSAKAFWLAEAGIQQVVSKLMTDADYRNTPMDITDNLGDGKYTVSAVKRPGKTIYDIASTGAVGDASRDIRQTAIFTSKGWTAPFADYGVFAGAASIIMQDRSKISGDVYTAGTVSTDTKSTVTGTVYADGGRGNYTRLPLPIPKIPAPILDRTYYTTLINTAGTYVKKNRTYSTLNLAGGTVYVNGQVTATNITGPGTVVCTGNFKINGGTVGQDVTIISNGTLSMANNSHIQPDAVLYASASISFTGNNGLLDNAALITPGTMTLDSNNTTINGVIFCGGDLTLEKNSIVDGVVVSGGTITMSDTAQVIQNKNQLPLNVPNGIESSEAASSVALSDWQGS